ncbi:MAG: hypothetical protein ACOC8K_05060 [Gemmatimonadota bacterium]
MLVHLSLLLVLAPRAVHGQALPGTTDSCDGRLVTAIEITPRDPSSLELPPGLDWVAGAVGLLHDTSSPGAIESFLLLEVGEPCTEVSRAESERILRAQSFLADATVRAVPDSSDGVRIEVETVDETAVVFGMGFRGLKPESIRFGNDNVGGQGLSVAAWVDRGFAYRTGLGIRAAASQVFGRPYRGQARAERATLGSELRVELGHPFFTDLQRTGWHMGFGDERRFTSHLRPVGEEISLEVRRRFWDVGIVRRIGVGRYSAFAGGLLTRESVIPGSRPVIVSDSGLVAVEDAALGGPFPAYRNLRVNGVLGVRALSFMPVRGFDAVEAVQDVAVGAQLGVLLGRGIPEFGDDEKDWFISTNLYGGLGSPRSFAAVRIEGEARRDAESSRWESMVVSGRLAWYLEPAPSRIVIGSLELGGAWRQRLPVQLALGDRGGGVRGYADSRVAGAVRSVARLEGRWTLDGFGERAAVGIAGFADAGRVWAGGAPFGVDSPTKVGVGIGLLVAVPARSQRHWRLDVALPVSADPHAGWEIRVSRVGSPAFWREPKDVAHARAGAAPSRIFTWP